AGRVGDEEPDGVRPDRERGEVVAAGAVAQRGVLALRPLHDDRDTPDRLPAVLVDHAPDDLAGDLLRVRDAAGEADAQAEKDRTATNPGHRTSLSAITMGRKQLRRQGRVRSARRMSWRLSCSESGRGR